VGREQTAQREIAKLLVEEKDEKAAIKVEAVIRCVLQDHMHSSRAAFGLPGALLAVRPSP
jgi:hypothetical protein